MGRLSSLSTVGFVLVACLWMANAAASPSPAPSAETKENKSDEKSSISAKQDTVLSTAATKTLKRETQPISSSKRATGGRSLESLRTAAQTAFGYNGINGYNGFNGYNGYSNGGFGFSPNYVGRDVSSGNTAGFNGQFQPATGTYNVLGQGQQSGFYNGQGAYYPGGSNYYSPGGFSGYPYASTGAYPFGGQGGFGFGGFNSGFYPGAQFAQGQLGERNFGFVNQGFGNPAFRNPQGVGVSSSGVNSIPSSVQVGTGLDVGSSSRGFSGNLGTSVGGGFPSASNGQQYIVGNGIGAPAFIGGAGSGTFGFGGPFGGLYSTGVPGGLYRQQNSLFGPYDYRRPLSGTSSSSTIARPSSSGSATRLQTSSPGRFYQGVTSGTYAPSSRERIYRYTSRDN